jgi:hypothetical protein
MHSLTIILRDQPIEYFFQMLQYHMFYFNFTLLFIVKLNISPLKTHVNVFNIIFLLTKDALHSA